MGSYEHYLAHHGILGQKWGIRRYQNENGTLTEAGKARYGEGATNKQIRKDAAKDAKKYARAKAYYGEGAGNRRKIIKNQISERMKNKEYAAEFERQMSKQDMAKHQKAASIERKTRDTAYETKRLLKKVGGFAVTAGSIAYAVSPEFRNKVNSVVSKYANELIRKLPI